MAIIDGFKKIKRSIKTSAGWQLLSQWTSASTVEFSDGSTLDTVLSEAITTEDAGEYEGTILRDADTLNGHDSEYFATHNEIGDTDISSLADGTVSGNIKNMNDTLVAFGQKQVKYTKHTNVSVSDIVNIKDDFVDIGIHRGTVLVMMQTGLGYDNNASVYMVYYNIDNANCYITPVVEGTGKAAPRLTSNYNLSLSTDTTKRPVNVGIQLLYEM